mmetsp:Transcript_2521/g.7834  ORF Transcript_2521/g.7834 Transcript_2521/m.7834 type:complete len:441 (-) Transcript_2521:13-1335(-)
MAVGKRWEGFVDVLHCERADENLFGGGDGERLVGAALEDRVGRQGQQVRDEAFHRHRHLVLQRRLADEAVVADPTVDEHRQALQDDFQELGDGADGGVKLRLRRFLRGAGQHSPELLGPHAHGGRERLRGVVDRRLVRGRRVVDGDVLAGPDAHLVIRFEHVLEVGVRHGERVRRDDAVHEQEQEHDVRADARHGDVVARAPQLRQPKPLDELLHADLPEVAAVERDRGNLVEGRQRQCRVREVPAAEQHDAVRTFHVRARRQIERPRADFRLRRARRRCTRDDELVQSRSLGKVRPELVLHDERQRRPGRPRVPAGRRLVRDLADMPQLPHGVAAIEEEGDRLRRPELLEDDGGDVLADVLGDLGVTLGAHEVAAQTRSRGEEGADVHGDVVDPVLAVAADDGGRHIADLLVAEVEPRAAPAKHHKRRNNEIGFEQPLQ